MPQLAPHFERPPLIEMVLGVQFSPLVALTSGHLGWFWKTRLGQEWEKTVDAVPLPPETETFGDPSGLSFPAFRFSLGPPPTSVRLQIINKTGDRMIQLQSSRFHYNWQQQLGLYPSYSQMRGDFDDYFGSF